MQQIIWSSWTFENTLAHSFRGEATQVCAMQLLIHSGWWSEKTHYDTHWGKALSMRSVWIFFNYKRQNPITPWWPPWPPPQPPRQPCHPPPSNFWLGLKMQMIAFGKYTTCMGLKGSTDNMMLMDSPGRSPFWGPVGPLSTGPKSLFWARQLKKGAWWDLTRVVEV